MTATYGTAGRSATIWPLIFAPLSAGIYYLALRTAFGQSMTSVLGIDLNDVAGLHWGKHWLYRLLAETASIAFGTFVAAGLARERVKLAAVIGGLTISVFYLIRLSFLVFTLTYLDADDYTLKEPAPQYLIDAIIIIAAPFIGVGASSFAQTVNNGRGGFGGVGRLHFLWLWIPAFLYARGLIYPVMSLWFEGEGSSRIGDLVHTIVFGVPVLILAVPLIYGLYFLGEKNGRAASIAESFGAVVILAVGWIAGMIAQMQWASLLDALFG